MTKKMTWPYIERTQARLELILSRLAQAKDGEDPIGLGQADAAALYGVASDAEEDLGRLLAALRQEQGQGVADEQFHKVKV